MLSLPAFSLGLLLLICCGDIEVKSLDIYSIQNDIAEFNITCYQDNCDGFRTDDLSSRSCHCGIQCVQLGTCCIDSYYAGIPHPKVKPNCRSIYNGGTYFIIDECPSDSVWATSCSDDWNGDDDMLKLVPVTSLLTSHTYKNYYCLKCHEITDEFLYWIVKVESEMGQYEISAEETGELDNRVSLTYYKNIDTWMAIYDEDIGYFPVNLSVQVPYKINKLAHVCEPGVISDCSENWSDEETRSKCLSYMSMKEVMATDNSVKYYKNIHCALCNFENLNDIACKKLKFVGFGDKIPFSFTYLLDINKSDGELVGKIQKCTDDHMWDPYANKCRKLACALPGFKVQNGKCVKE